MKIEVVNLKKHFGVTRAVDDVSFAFSSGEVVGFVGPNGAGKTTTMRILATLDEPTAGDALIDGVSVVEEPERARHLIGYVPDSLPAHRDISVHEYLDFFARAYGLKGAHRAKVVESVEEFTNLAGIRDKMLNALSKGMKQRVSLARALLHDPPTLIMDEPAAGLDPRARIELRELIRALSSQGKAILISSHILTRSEEHTSELQSLTNLVCRLLLEKKKQQHNHHLSSTGVRLIAHERRRVAVVQETRPHRRAYPPAHREQPPLDRTPRRTVTERRAD